MTWSKKIGALALVVAAGAALGVYLGVARAAVSQTMHAFVHQDDSIGLTFDDGSQVGNQAAVPPTIPPGTYSIRVLDDASEHNFHVVGPGVDQSTDIGGSATPSWSVTLQPGSIYRFVCDNHPDFMYGTFQTSGQSSGSSGSGSSGGGSVSTGGSGSTSSTGTKSSAAVGQRGDAQRHARRDAQLQGHRHAEVPGQGHLGARLGPVQGHDFGQGLGAELRAPAEGRQGGHDLEPDLRRQPLGDGHPHDGSVVVLQPARRQVEARVHRYIARSYP